MKKGKKLLALLMATLMVFGSAFTALAEEYEVLQYGTVQYKTYQSRVLGEYPDVAGVKGLTAQIKEDLDDAYTYERDENDDGYENDSSAVTYTVEDKGQYVIVTVLLTIDRASDSAFRNKVVTLTYYIDKAEMSVIDEAAYLENAPAEGEEGTEAVGDEEGTEAVEGKEEVVEAVEEEVEVVAPTEVAVYAAPIRTVAELGYTLAWDGETRTVTVSLGDYSTTVVVGVNAYETADGVITLDMAPYIEDDLTYVPVSFFEKVLGLVVSVDEAGNVTLDTPVVEEALVDDAEVPVAEEAVEGVEATDEAVEETPVVS